MAARPLLKSTLAALTLAAVVASGCTAQSVVVRQDGTLRPGEPSKLTSPTPNTRIEAQGYDGSWGTLCVAPCRPQLGPRQRYRVVSNGYVTGQFAVSDERPLEINFQPRNDAALAGGVALMIGGGAGLFTGYVLLIVGALSGDGAEEGASLMGISLLGMVGGAALIHSSRPELVLKKNGQFAVGDRIPIGGGLEVSAQGLHF